jgi:hypothetical protein
MEKDPVDKTAEKIVTTLKQLDANMEKEGFFKPSRVRAIQEAVNRALEKSMGEGLLTMETEEDEGQ